MHSGIQHDTAASQGQRGDEPKIEVHLPPTDERSGGRASSGERKLKLSVPKIASNASPVTAGVSEGRALIPGGTLRWRVIAPCSKRHVVFGDRVIGWRA